MVGLVASRRMRSTPPSRADAYVTFRMAGLKCATLMATGGCRFFSYATWRSISIFESPALPHLAAVHDNPASARTKGKKWRSVKPA